MNEADLPSADIDALLPWMEEVTRQEKLKGQILSFQMPDSDFMNMLDESRGVVNGMMTGRTHEQRTVRHVDAEQGVIDTPLPLSLILILAEQCRRVRDACEAQWALKEGVRLFHDAELPGAAHVKAKIDSRSGNGALETYERAALGLETDARDIIEGKTIDPNFLQGTLKIEGPASDRVQLVSAGVASRVQRIFNIPPAHIAREMKNWTTWQRSIVKATPADAPEIHSIYERVLITMDELIALDPRYSTPEKFKQVTDAIRGEGRMFKPLKKGGEGDDVLEGIEKGRVVVARDASGAIIGYYEVIDDIATVIAKAKKELFYSRRASTELPEVRGMEGTDGTFRRITYPDREGAMRVFRKITEGKLVWSVDHAVLPASDGARRYAQLGTALKLNNYDAEEEEKNKDSALLKIISVIGVDASKAAAQRGIAPVDRGLWAEAGMNQGEDRAGMIILPRPVVNVGSFVLNQRLGGHEAIVVEEEFEREGVRVLALWRYLEQPLPYDMP